MSDNNSCEDMKKFVVDRRLFTPLRHSTSTPVLNSDAKIMTMVDKAIQIDMDCEPDEDPKKNKKYWQDLAGLRGAREQYLKYDLSELSVKNLKLTNTIQYLMWKLKFAEKEIADMKANKCSCQKEERYIPKSDSSICL